MPGPCRSRRASTCCRPASARRSASRCSARDLDEMEKVAREIEAVVRKVPGTTSAYAERVTGGYYLDIDAGPRRSSPATGSWSATCRTSSPPRSAARAVTTTVEGRERYTVNVRYPRDFRDDPASHRRRVLVPLAERRHRAAGRGGQGRARRRGPTTIRTENGAACGLHLRRHPRPRHRRLRRRCAEGRGGRGQAFRRATTCSWSGQFEYMRARQGAAQDRGAGDAR